MDEHTNDSLPEHAAEHAPHAPPVRPSGPISDATPRWPTVIGVLLIVFGGVGLLMRGFSLVASFAMQSVPMFADALPPPHLWAWTIVLGIVGLPVSLLHLLAGVQTVRRRPSAYALAMGFVAYAVLVLIPGTILQYQTTQWQFQQAAQQGQPMPPAMTSGVFVLATMLLGVAFSLAWPTFVAVWYNIGSHRALVRGWAAHASDA